MKLVLFTSAALFSFSTFFSPLSFGQIPRTISYQGVLTDGSGNFIPDGNHSLTLRLYQQASGGSPVYEESQTVAVIKGLFNVIIGTATPIPGSLSFDRAYYLGVSVNGGTELVPRTAMSAAPYALYAQTAGTAQSLAPGVTGVVTSVNNQSGALTLQGGGSTTVTNAGDTILISSTDSVSLSGWGLTGNAATDPSTNFLGTTDSTDYVIKTNNYERIRFTANGLIDIKQALDNLFIGRGAGLANETGTGNTALGITALNKNTTGSYNTASGHSTLLYNTTGHQNTACGYGALYYNTTGDVNSAFGDQALGFNMTGRYNTAAGASALRSNVVGDCNSAYGTGALFSSTAGSYNTAMGYSAIFSSESSMYNAAFGYAALYSNDIGDSNTAVGAWTLYSNGGEYNTALGVGALHFNTLGNYNTAIGIEALSRSTTGYSNTAVGRRALDVNTTGGYNTAVGNLAGPVTNSTGLENTTALGNSATVSASNQVRIGSAAVTSIGGQVGWTTLSDDRAKRNIDENVAGLDFILRLRPVTYRYDLESIYTLIGHRDESEYVGKDEIENITFSGFLAQEVERAGNEIGYDFSGVDLPKNAHDPYGLRYGDFVVPLVKAMQEQQQMIHEQRIVIGQLQQRLQELEDITSTPIVK